MIWSWAPPSVSSCCTCSPLFLQSSSSMSNWQREPAAPPLLWELSLSYFYVTLGIGSPLPPILSQWFAIIFYVCPSWDHKLPEDSNVLDSSLCPQLLAQCLDLEYSQQVLVKWINEYKHRPNQVLGNAFHPVQEIFLALGSWWLYFGGYVPDFFFLNLRKIQVPQIWLPWLLSAPPSWCVRPLI